MAVEKNESTKPAKAPKLADPIAASIDVASQQMIRRAQDLGVETVFDRAVNMKPCNIGIQGICCKNCAMGPCRLPLPKGGIEGEDTRKGLCGATANTIAARNFARMVAAGAAAHSDHGRAVAEVFLSVARKETEDYRIKDPGKLLAIAHTLGVATTVEVDGEQVDRDIDEIALEFAEKALAEWGKAEGTLEYLKRAPKPLYEKWKKTAFCLAISIGRSSRSCTAPTWGWTRIIKTLLSNVPGHHWRTAGADRCWPPTYRM